MQPSLWHVAGTAVAVLLGGAIPVLWFVFTERFQEPPSPSQYAVLLLILGLLGVLLFIPVIAIIAGTGLLGIGLAWLNARSSLVGVTYQRHLWPRRIFAGDEAKLVIDLTNDKLLPLAWLKVTDPLSFADVTGHGPRRLLEFSSGLDWLHSDRPSLVVRTGLGPLQRLHRTIQIRGLVRGVYSLGPATIATSDVFGIFPRQALIEDWEEIIVYPRVYSPEEIGLPYREALGTIQVRRHLIDDPLLIAGARDYQPGDPLRLMHWKATARTGELHVRVHDASTTAQIMFVVNLNTAYQLWEGVDRARMETTIEVAASLALWALDHDFQVGLTSNGTLPGTEHNPRLNPGAGENQATRLLEHLARIAFAGGMQPERLLGRELQHRETARSLVLVTPLITPPLARALRSARSRDRVSVVYCGRHVAPVIPGVPVFVANPGEIRAVS